MNTQAFKRTRDNQEKALENKEEIQKMKKFYQTSTNKKLESKI